MIKETKKLPFIDALRGWAVLGVILSHCAFPGWWGYWASFMGGKGVQLFFVLSAFTLFSSHSRRIKSERRPVRNFFLRRLFRIVPMFYIAAIVFLLVNGTGPSYWAPNGLSWWHIFTTFTFTNGWHPETINTIVFGGWSVADEEGFYAMFIGLYYLARKPKGAVLLTLFFMVFGLIVSPAAMRFWIRQYPGSDQHVVISSYFSELWLPAQACIFTMGICLFHLWQRVQISPSGRFSWVPLALVSASALFGLVVLPLFPYIQLGIKNHAPIHYGMLFVALTYGLAQRPYRFLVNPFVNHFGRISFSVYLVHSFGIRLGEEVVTLAGIQPSSFIFGIAQLLIAMTFSLVVGTATYRLVELEGIEAGRRLIERLERRDEARA